MVPYDVIGWILLIGLLAALAAVGGRLAAGLFLRATKHADPPDR